MEIAGDLHRHLFSRRPSRPEVDISLAGGKAGASLFFSYLDLVLPGQGYGDLAIETLDQAIAGLDGIASRPELYHGFVGIAWVLEHVHDWIVDNDGEDPGGEIADTLQRFLHRSLWEHFELMGGLVGLGVHALERHQRRGEEECLRQTVYQLAATAQRRDGTATWWTPPAPMPDSRGLHLPEGHFNLGMAHGTTGVVAFLAEACAAGQEVQPLLTEAVNWILAQKLPPGSGSVFPTHIAPDGDAPSAGLGWCYGDLGIAIALLKAAGPAGEEAWKTEALATAQAAALLRPQMMDATICHGTAGLAQLFNRLYQATADPLFAEAATFWVEQTLGLRKPGKGIGGFLAYNLNDRLEVEWTAEPGFLRGAAGIGLALLAAATPIEPAWDRVLLVTLPCIL